MLGRKLSWEVGRGVGMIDMINVYVSITIYIDMNYQRQILEKSWLKDTE